MTDLEKVIKGLEKCKRYECDDCTEKGATKAPWDCPAYDDFVDSAIALLKAQEPRLLTIEEITGDGECWFEGINGACGYADCYMCTGSKEVEVNRISMKPEYVSWDDFKKKWRCWSYRPTDEQRKAVKWE